MQQFLSRPFYSPDLVDAVCEAVRDNVDMFRRELVQRKRQESGRED
jgi:hypothetical protein